MEQQQVSPGLLYSTPPEGISSLHLQDDFRTYGLNWEELKTQSISLAIFSFLKKTATNWGIAKLK